MLTEINLIKKINFLILLFFPLFIILGNGFINLSLIIITLSCIILFIKKKIYLFSKTENILIGGFFLYVSLNSLFNFTNIENFLKSLGLFRYIFFSVAIVYTLNNISLNQFKKIKFFYLLVIIFVTFDVIFQYLTGSDIFGFKPGMCENGNCLRFQGPFGDELIAGSFLAYFGLIAILLFFTKWKLNLLFLTLGIVIVLTGDRSPFISFLIFLFIYILISDQKIFNKFLLIFFSILIFFLVINILSSSKARYFKFSQEILIIEGSETKNDFNLKNVYENIKQSPWGKHYQVAWAMFLDKPISGHGYNSFPIKCKKFEEITNTNYGNFRGCSSHPHNALLEILAEQGLIGFVILSTLIFYILRKLFFIKSKNIDLRVKFILSGVLFLTFYFPLKPTGSLFSTWLGSLTFFVYGFYLFFLDKVKSKNI